jgi:hypothetical protein
MTRCSSLPLAVRCPASLAAEIAIDPYSDDAERGTNIHRAIALAARGKQIPPLEDDEEVLVSAALMMLEDTDFKGTRYIEQSFQAGELSGTIDLLEIDYDRALVQDWKSGWGDKEYEAQMMGYAWLVFQKYPDLEEVMIRVVRLQLQKMDVKVVSRAYAESWYEELVRNTLHNTKTFSPGGHCDKCPRQAECPALAAQNRQMALMLFEGEQALTRKTVPELWYRVAAAQKVLDYFHAWTRNQVSAHGPIDMGNGKQLALITTHRTKIDASKTWPFMEEALTPNEVAACVTIKKTDLEEALKAHAPKGKKGETVKAFFEKLAAAGATAKEPFQMLREVNANTGANNE